ncbi:MAG: vanX [Rickettsiaceae bacterium]|jgi:D-alanyl-D-alanine dipeptidase|nr:vanX [Rickettsiaceae bacterium]
MPLPPDFDYLENIDPTIIQEVRYAGYHNFIGRPIAGYTAPKCVVLKKLGYQLKEAQKIALDKGYSLKLYEAYRPLKASAQMVEWSQDPEDQIMKEEFYKHVDKKDVFKLGYVALQSGHTRGAAVDVTLVKMPPAEQPEYKPGDKLFDSILPQAERFPDNSIDMGTGYDCFNEKAHTHNLDLTPEQIANRTLLHDIMKSAGFEEYPYEWWHFKLADEQYPNTYFDFDIA